MTLTVLIDELRRDGVRLWLQDDRIRYLAPKGCLSEQRLAQISRNRDQLLRLLRDAKVSGRSAIMPQERRGPMPVSYAQERLWIIQERDRDRTYNLLEAWMFDGPLSLAAMQAAIDGLIERHEPLRTRFDLDDNGQLLQIIDPPRKLPLRIRDVRQAEVMVELARHADHLFDLRRGPLIRLQILRLSPQQHIVAALVHHVIADGWSASILANDAKELYAAHLHGKPAALAPLKVQFADYAHWQRLQDLSDQLAYWTNKLAGYGGPLDLTAGQDRRGADRGPVGLRAVCLLVSPQGSIDSAGIAERLCSPCF
jgi:hypothetical protein